MAKSTMRAKRSEDATPAPKGRHSFVYKYFVPFQKRLRPPEKPS